MIKMDVKVDRNTFTAASKRVQTQLNKLPKDAYNYFYAQTPIRTGNARMNTRLSGSNVIEANYPYAGKLDKGYSRQAPQGMIVPTEKFVRQKLKSILGK